MDSNLSEKLFRIGWTPTDNGCWEWNGRRSITGGYGELDARGKTMKAHRAAYMAWIAEPNNLHVLHTCDNRICINPEHLFLGTNADNVIDRVIKQRSARLIGSINPNSKLTEADASEIYRRRTGGELLKSLASEYGVSYSVVSDIANKRTWRHIHGEDGEAHHGEDIVSLARG